MIIKDRSLVFLPADIKSWMAMTFRGLEFCHRNWILHRVCSLLHVPHQPLTRSQDLKPNNLLIASDGQLKIADFGLARDFADPGYKMTCQVITRWYRPPELLYGGRYYGTAVDIWSVGCIFAELMLRIPYLPGESDMDQIKTIFRALGTPTEEDWPVGFPILLPIMLTLLKCFVSTRDIRNYQITFPLASSPELHYETSSPPQVRTLSTFSINASYTNLASAYRL